MDDSEQQVSAENSAAEEPGMADADVVKMGLDRFRAMDLARQEIERAWDENWDEYRGDHDHGEKADWQSQEVVPRVFSNVEHAAATVRRALQGPQRWWDIEAESGNERVEKVVRALIDINLERAAFADLLHDGVKAGFLCSLLAAKVYPDTFERMSIRPVTQLASEGMDSPGLEVRRTEPGVRIELIDPYDLFLDENGGQNLVCVRSRVSFSDYLARVKEGQYAIGEGFVESYTDEDQRGKRLERMGMAGAVRDPNQVELLEFWGRIESPNGDLIEPCGTFTICNRKHLAAPIGPNPFWHQKPPIVWGAPLRVPFSSYHMSLMTPTLGLARLLTDFTNLAMDGAAFAMIPMVELDPSAMDDPQQVEEGIYPGLTLVRKAGADPSRQAIMPAKAGALSREAFEVLNFLDREIQQGSAVVEVTQGAAPMKSSRRTLGEFQLKTGMAQVFFNAIARSIEKSFLEPLLEMVGEVELQFRQNFDLPSVRKALGEEADMVIGALNGMDRATRFSMLGGAHTYRAHGISAMLAREQEMGKIASAMSYLIGNPFVNQRKLADKVLGMLDLGDVAATDQEIQQQAQQAQRAVQQASMQGGMGQPPQGAPPGRGGA